MSSRFYGYLWILYFAIAGIMWVTGTLSMLAIVVFGFVAFGMVFIGMMNVLPEMVSHPAPKITNRQPVEAKKAVEVTTASSRPDGSFSAYRSA